MARAAVPGRLGARLRWLEARLTGRHDESDTARTLVFDVPGWPGHLPGQHLDVRLTAADGYSTQRSYSIASAPDGERVELTVERIDDGEVSPYLVDVLEVGDVIELRGPVGGWFVWRPDEQKEPVLLVAGGSGIVPLMAMIRTRRALSNRVPFRLVYSLRSPRSQWFVPDLRTQDPGLDKTFLYSRSAPEGWPRPPGRITANDLSAGGWPPDFEPVCYVCGSTGFVETAAGLLVALGHDPRRIRTERFGPGG
ncbi:ferredoxin reductase [Streptomyces cellulosae]|uniref:ferredoxin reductase n=1 Tax=Streptomyces sp. Akac8 TaxID=2563106 RepID=UPI00109EDD51|nr:oxidoreductase [Streptomyces sp. Akac8]WSB95044.1 ferredoxin reductase [Streptomyces cellulosae]WTC14734.1 ferredoxin reductase [Streptomyces cellulosae]